MKSATLGWLQFQFQRREARQWARRNGVQVAAYAMFHLNQYARHPHSPRRRAVYAMKNHLIRWMYENGYARHVTTRRQRMVCWRCNGTGTYFVKGDCFRCGGTGVYKDHTLYEFVFDVNGRCYICHQPGVQIDYPVQAAEPGPDQFGKIGGWEGGKPAGFALYVATVYEFLRMHGVKRPCRLPTLRQAILEDWRTSNFRYRFLRWKYVLKSRRQMIAGKLMGKSRNDELPF